MMNLNFTPSHDVTLVLFMSIYCLFIYLIFYFRNKHFLSFDSKPAISGIQHLKIKNDLSKIPVVKTGFVIETFPVMDIKNNSFIINGVVWFRFNRSLVSLESIEQFSFLNASEFEKKLSQVSVIEDDFLIQYKVHIEFYSNLDHHFFPLNDHSIYLMMVNNELTSEEVVFDSEDGSFFISKDLPMHDWIIKGSSVETGFEDLCISDVASQPIPYPRVLYTINIKKAGLRKLSLIIFPIILLFLVSALTLLLGDLHTSLRISIGTLTGILSYRYVINNLSPNVGYLTLAEYLYNCCFILIALSFLFVVDAQIYGEQNYPNFGYLWFYSSATLFFIYMIYLLFFKAYKSPEHSKVFNFDKYIETIKVPKLTTWDLSKIKKHYHLYQHPIIGRVMALFLPPIMSWRYVLRYMHDYQGLNQAVSRDLVVQAHMTSRCVVFVNLPATTEFIDDLEKLIEMNIIDKDLILKSPYDYIIVNQHICKNVDDLAAIFPLLIILMLKNPLQVFMLEDSEYVLDIWQDNLEFNYTKDLYRKYPEQFQHFISNFFSSLPRQILLERQYPDSNYVVQVLSENTATYFDNHYEELKEIIPVETIQARVLNLNSHIYHDVNQRLLLKMPHRHYMRWFMSCESDDSEEIAMISFNHERKDAYLDWYSCLKGSKSKFKVQRYSLSYGFKLSSKTNPVFVSDKPLRIVSSLDLSKSLKVFSTNMVRGLSLGALQQNISGGINQQALKLIVNDDTYNPILTVKNIDEFLLTGDRPGLLLNLMGTPNVDAVLPRIDNNKGFLFFPITGAEHLRVAKNKNLVFFRASYQLEVEKIVHDVLSVNNCKRIGILYQNDSFGLSLLNPTKKLLDEIPGDHLHVDAPYQRNNPNIHYAADIIQKFNPDALIFFAVSAPSIALIHELGISQVADMHLYISSPGNLMLVNFLKTLGLGIHYCSTVPPLNENIEIVREYYRSYQQAPFAYDPSLASLEGFINLTLMSHILSQITPPYTCEAINEVIAGFKDYEFKGLHLNFNPDTRELFNHIWLINQ